MEKADAVASLGVDSPSLISLLKPAQVRLALKANDRLKLYLSVLQAAVTHAHAPHVATLDLGREIAAADITERGEAAWLNDLPATASLDGTAVRVPDFLRLVAHLKDELAIMARPVVEGDKVNANLQHRVAAWLDFLEQLSEPIIQEHELVSLTHGQRDRGDSLHITVMDLHKALNHLATEFSNDVIDGAHCWMLADDGSDRPRIAAFMRGLNRTKPLKLDHPGLDTAATRDGSKLLLQNDIGTNDAHVLVLQVDTSAAVRRITLTYSDLHRQRFAFFQRLLSEAGAQWDNVERRKSPGLNAGDEFHVGVALFEAEDEAVLAQQLEGIGERIVFLIDWNRARKRLLPFVGKRAAIQVLEAAAQRRVGHMAWLVSGAERLIWNAMAAQGVNIFSLGDRLDAVLGEEQARDFLIDTLVLSSQTIHEHDNSVLIADQVSALLARRLHGKRSEYVLLEEHAGFCHALAQTLRDALLHNQESDLALCTRFAARAKTWERRADELVMQARDLAERQPQWQPLATLIECSDEVADQLEEACFILSVLAEHFVASSEKIAWAKGLRDVFGQLSESVVSATQDYIKSLVLSKMLADSNVLEDQREYLRTIWLVQQEERHADELLRSVRHALVLHYREHADAVVLNLSNEFAAAMENASDALLVLTYNLRDYALQSSGVLR
ncbi:MAG: phosphate transport regulator [Pelistega sp.]|nr:phosphate transport regulator [Pelistega sp.]